MKEIESEFVNVLSQVDGEFDKKFSYILEEIEDIQQQLLELAKNNGFSVNALLDNNELRLTENTDENSLPYGLRLGNLMPAKGESEYLKINYPSILPFSKTNATAFLIDDGNETDIRNLFQLFVFRLLLSLPVNLCKFHFIDTYSFGKGFKFINQLSDKIIENALIDDDKKLTELITELEHSIRDINRTRLSKYDSLEDYNREAGSLAVPFRFVFISHFPYGFNKDLADRLLSLIKNHNATKAGVYIFYSIDNDVEIPHGFDITDFINNSTFVHPKSNGDYEIDNSIFDSEFKSRFSVQLNPTYPANIEDIIKHINHEIGGIKSPPVSLDSQMKQLIETNQYWKESTQLGFKVPIGKKPIDDTVYFEFGGDSADYFAMIGGRPGFGKTVLLHDIICNASIIYSPEELSFYLIDCTNGTGFKPYDKLPHAKFVSITNEREYTVSALQTLIEEMYARANLFKYASDELGTPIEKIEEYRKKSGNVLPRIVVIIDEFQVLLENEDKISRKAKGHLEKLIREGRKYGINIIFCTQSYRNLDFNTDLITLRIAFNLKEYDSVKVLGGNNEAAASLTKKGEAILNNQNGNPRANIKFQAAYTDKMMEYVNFCVSKVGELENYNSERFVFDGTINSDISTNETLAKILNRKSPEGNRACKVYIGVPSFICNEHIYFKIRRNPCSNLLMVGNDVNAAMATIALANFQLQKQSPSNSNFVILDFLSSDDERSNYYANVFAICDNVQVCRGREVANVVDEIEKELNERIENDKNNINNADKGRIVLSLSYIQNAKDLKKDGYNPSPITKKLIKILKDGPDFGIHLMVYSYTYKGLLEVLEQNVLNEFENKIVLSEGGGLSILAEQFMAEPKDKGYGLLQADDETCTYNPDPFVFYNRFSGKNAGADGEILREILAIYNRK
jgi:hypothetical protein